MLLYDFTALQSIENELKIAAKIEGDTAELIATAEVIKVLTKAGLT